MSKVKLLIKYEETNALQPFSLYLFKLESGKLNIPSFKTEEIPTSFRVDTDAKLISYALYFLRKTLNDELIDGYKFEGIVRNEEEIIIKIEIKKIINFKNYFYLTLHEILNETKIMNYFLHNEDIEIFLNFVTIPTKIPYVFYGKEKKNKINFVFFFGKEREEEDSEFGPFYYLNLFEDLHIADDEKLIRYCVFLDNYAINILSEDNSVFFCNENKRQLIVKNKKFLHSLTIH
jgi:hypothetical protein